MRYHYGNTACISTQAGTNVWVAVFCASTIDGIERNLTAGEMLAQIYEIQKDIEERISSVVLMGSGEPLDNYDNVLRFIHLANDEKRALFGTKTYYTFYLCFGRKDI